MSIAERDYILRTIQQIAQAVAAILLKKREGKLDEALSMLEALRRRIFGSMRDPLDRLDPSSVATVLGDREKARAYAVLLAVEADVREERGDARAAAQARRRALSVHLETSARWPGDVTDDDRAAVAALQRLVTTPPPG
jgi:hypothetical protein